MKVLFAVSNEEITESIVKKYQKQFKQIISYKNVYYFNAILKELQKDKTYDRVVISEELESFSHTQYEQIDKFIFDKMDSISDEAIGTNGEDIPIIVICSDRREKGEQLLVKLFSIGVYNAIIGNDRSIDEVSRLINRPRSKKDAKSYYKIESDDVKYQYENENDVSEVEIQNILAHYKRIGKDEQKYIESFKNISEQYNDVQLRLISKILPSHIRAVLETSSPEYQKVMTFNNVISNNLRDNDKKETKPNGKLLKNSSQAKPILSKPVVIPKSINMNNGKKLATTKPVQQIEENIPLENLIEEHKYEEPEIEVTPITEIIDQNKEEAIDTVQETVIEQPVKKGRGRPKKNPSIVTEPVVKKKRGRPKKDEVETVLPDFENTEPEETVLPGFDNAEPEETVLPGFENIEPEETVLPGFDDTEPEETVLSGFDNIEPEETVLPGFDNTESEETVLPGFNNTQPEETVLSGFDNVKSEISDFRNDKKEEYVYKKEVPESQEYIQTIDLEYLLTPGKKIVSFVGTSKNGTSFVVNNVAELLSTSGVDVAIFDATQNKNSYYIYTQNQEKLRVLARESNKSLCEGFAKGIQVHKNLTVYTSLPNEEDEYIHNVDKILETLIQKHSLVLIDTDYETNIGYFKQSQQICLVQTFDILTIQPLTAFLRNLKAKNIIEQNKLRVILNKSINLKGIADKNIIGGMAFYNDPGMSYMTELFDVNTIQYISIPFDPQIYIEYLQGIAECEITLKKYSKNFLQILSQLGKMIYSNNENVQSGNYRPPSVNTNNNFSPSMNSTLEQMKKKY